ncbi:hypothetical protein I307_03719 [Cryptococcus deuterogattii 99/473]|uniref:HD/PDEase domain-containing protein n=1 Tax=Cryptococcus deuterogattii Ram5 TaxID=1296110 RepID=A0A0D0V752_9TREE|nr:hypothetical protein I309_00746 [Cryptococcus deuterogattii LA55]KIR36730.1 hypothetical protein I352_00041 [Cryptococcus deuterogattii MMRL2647]KIR43201.1 hypothetical protein I313_00042 [Cryptococcus deuterogattii Ram5]KIR92539.1 hypothetical protein I304_03944 [Cryptococcus deuterogattii CBS 10090]KIS01705.1 hypothetical protein L804_01584 [Cryptococcus deuterogattii 2001/935-1]KIY56981.1 hypothetical protein I307_03719 [Cryptococcus deuterogattii 99/473]
MTTFAYSDLIGRAEELVKAHMAKYDPSHDWAHVDRVRKMAMTIARSMDNAPDLLVVELAALFHDLSDKYAKLGSPTLSDMLFPILQPQIPNETIERILSIIPSVSYTAETALLAAGGWTWQNDCLELHAVQDADRLDAIGAVGILRCAAYSGATKRLLVENGDTGGKSAEAHFEEKLLKVRDRMKTAFGKEEAERRHQTS